MASPREFIPLQIAILTVSDTRTLADDKSGQTLQDRITAVGHSVSDRQISKDDIAKIRRIVKAWSKRSDIDVIISTGGTGLTGRDVTIEAMRPLFEKEIGAVVLKTGGLTSVGALSTCAFFGIPVIVTTQRGNPVAILRASMTKLMSRLG